MTDYEMILIPNIVVYFTLFLLAVWIGKKPDNPVSVSALICCDILGLVLFLCECTRLFG